MSEAPVAYCPEAAPRRRAGGLWLVAEPRAGYDAAASQAWGTVDAGAALAGLAAAAQRVARADLAALDERGLLEHTVELDRLITRLQAARAQSVAAVDRRGAYGQDACVTTGSWLRWRTRRDFAATTRMVVTARRLEGLPLTRAALAAAEITLAHADAIAQAATPQRWEAIAASEDVLVGLARAGLPRDVRRACARIADAVDRDGADPGGPADGGDPAEGQGGPDPRRELRFARTFEGLGDLRATLDPVTAERLRALLDAFDQPDAADAPMAARRSFAQRRHDAFDRILRAAEEHPDAPSVHGARPHALVTIDLLALLGRDELASRRPRLGSGVEIDLARALALLGEASFTPVLMWGPWRAVAVGRRHRTLPDWLRPLLALIHGSCRGPGCDRPIAWTDAAHLTAWAAGGHTDLDATIPACPGHHQLMDRLGWTVTLDPDTAICTWTCPHGTTVLRTHPPEP